MIIKNPKTLFYLIIKTPNIDLSVQEVSNQNFRTAVVPAHGSSGSR